MKQLASPLLRRVLAFATVFVLLSGIIGPHIISSGILYRYHFDIYGGAGKALLFAVAAFLVLTYRKAAPRMEPWRYHNFIWFALAAISLVLAWLGVNQLMASVHSAYWPLATHLALLASVCLATLGCFGPGNLRRIFAAYRRELLLSLGIAALFYAFLLAVYGLWQVLAGAVLYSVQWLLHLSGLAATVVPPHTLQLDKFSVWVAQYCSGIESIALFTGLYALIGALDWQRFNKCKFLLILPVALLILFALNILRVYLLILAGYYINPHIAFSLFHTYAGMVFFILYSAIFWCFAYKWMLSRDVIRKTSWQRKE